MEPLINKTIGEVLHYFAMKIPGNDCVVSPQHDTRYTWAQFDAVTDRIARGLMALGFEKGDHIAMWAPNVPEWMIVQFATAKIGVVLVTVNTNYKRFELEYLLRQSDSKALVLIDAFKDSNYVEHAMDLIEHVENGKVSAKGLPFLKYIIHIGDFTPNGLLPFTALYAAATSVSQAQLDERAAQLRPHDVINMQYTSGTTGFPKGVMLTHHNIVNNGKCIGDCMKLTEDDRLLIVVPLFHCFGCVLGVMACLTHGTGMILVDAFSPTKVMATIEAEKCTAVHGVPTMFIAILGHPDFAKYDMRHLRTGIMAGSPCPITTMRECVDRMHMRDITISYGLTEASPVFTMTRTDDPIELRVTTVGRIMPHCEAKIIDPETGLEQPCSVPGEIVTRGYHLMKGYYKMPEATKAAINAEGFLHTGDIGTVDENGYYKITGRLKDMIIRGGENIYPREIEEFLYTHPAVSDVQVVGVPDERYGEEVLAYIIPKESCGITEDEIIKYVKDGLSRFKAPKYVRFIDEFPMTASGKIQKYKLRERGIAELHLEAAANIETA